MFDDIDRLLWMGLCMVALVAFWAVLFGWQPPTKLIDAAAFVGVCWGARAHWMLARLKANLN